MYRTKIDEINQRKEEELKTLKSRIQKLHSDVAAANQVRPQSLSHIADSVQVVRSNGVQVEHVADPNSCV